MIRAAFITNIIPEYRYPIFDEISRAAGKDNLRIFVTNPLAKSCRSARGSLPLRYSTSLLLSLTTYHGESGGSQNEPLPLPIGLIKDLLVYRPDIVVSGEFGFRSLVCWIAARAVGARFALWSEEIGSSARGRSAAQRRMREFLVKRADAFLAWGAPARAYLAGLGVEQQHIFECSQAIDNKFWLRQAVALHRDEVRRALNLTGTVFLLVGRLLPRKGFRNFLEAWRRLPGELRSSVTAVVAGDGDSRNELIDLAARHELTNIRFVGSRSPEQLAQLYTAADVFVFPSLEDVWGLVVNEAMCFGLPILASKFAGASQELIAGSDVGVLFDPANINEFAGLLTAWAESPPRRNMQRSHEIIAQVNFEKSISAIQSMLLRLGEGRTK